MTIDERIEALTAEVKLLAERVKRFVADNQELARKRLLELKAISEQLPPLVARAEGRR